MSTPHDGPIPYDPSQDDQPSGHAPGNAARILALHEARLMAIPGVTGVGVGAGPLGVSELVLYVSNSLVKAPRTLDGLNVRVIVTGPIDAQ
ncbi:hypothetical protein LBMAG48_07780 [Phycisphaerae bacterium]|nr:hypothetical protein LBMAG48_07780 [Phycisphaerae bacterium]